MKSRDQLLDDGLRSIDPLVGSDTSRLSSGDDELLASIVSSDRDEAIDSRRSPRHRVSSRGRRRFLVAIPVTAALLVALIAGLPGGGDGSRGGLPALARVAQAAAAQAPSNTSLPYVYVKTRELPTETTVAGGEAWSVYEPKTQEEWIAEDGSGRVRTVEDPPRWVGPKDREAWEAAGRVRFLAHGWASHTDEEEVPAGHFHAWLGGGGALSEIPTDPTALAAWLENRVKDPRADAGAGNGFSIAVRTLTLVADLLNNPLATPELRAALYEAEGRIPGIEYLGEVTDQIGRRGVAVGAESANSGAPTLYSLIFDPRTSQVLATQEKVLEAPPALPDEGYPRTESRLFLDSGTTDTLSGRPR
jgi:hypothetical protein